MEHTDLFPWQDWGRSWQGFRLGVNYCWCQYIVFLDIHNLQVHLPRLPFLNFDLCIFHLLHQRSLILKHSLRCYCKLSVGCKQSSHTDLLSPQTCGRPWRGCRFCDFTCNNQIIDCMQVNHINVFLFILVNIFLQWNNKYRKKGNDLSLSSSEKTAYFNIYCYQSLICRIQVSNKGKIRVW